MLVVGGALVAIAELLNELASRSPRPPDQGPVGVVVLGYPTKRDGSPHPIQRHRVDAAVAVARAHEAEVVVMSGGAVRREIAEAEIMAARARDLGLDPRHIRTEVTSRNTWENVAKSAPFVADCPTVIVVSDPMHAARARRYWQRQFPDEADRVFPGGERRPFAHWWVATPAAFYELAIAVRDRIRFGI